MRVNDVLTTLLLLLSVAAVALTIIILGMLLLRLNHTLRRVEMMMREMRECSVKENIPNSEKSMLKEIHETIHREIHETVHRNISAPDNQDEKAYVSADTRNRKENCTDSPDTESLFVLSEDAEDNMAEIGRRLVLNNVSETTSWGFQARFAESIDGHLIIIAKKDDEYYVKPFMEKISEKEYKFGALRNCFEFSAPIAAGALYRIVKVTDACIMKKKKEFYEIVRKGKVLVEKISDY